MPIGAAIGGAAIIGAGATVYASNQAAGASKKATDAATALQTASLNNAKANYADISGDVNPFLTAGTNALGQISSPSAAAANFQAGPAYNFDVQQGLNAVNQGEAANGLLKSGGAAKALTNYAEGQADNAYNTWWNQQQGLVNTGVSAASVKANAAANTNNTVQNNANATGNLLQNNATTQGNASIANGNAVSSGVGSLASLITQYGTQQGTGSSFNVGQAANDTNATADALYANA